MININRLKIKYKSSIVALSFIVIGATTSFAQQDTHTTTLSLQECRERALENNIESNIAKEQITAAGYRVTVYKTNYWPKLSAAGTYLYSDAKFGRTIMGGNLPTFMPDGQGGAMPNGGFAFMPDIPLELKVKSAYNGSLRIEQPIFTGGKITAAYNMAKWALRWLR